MSRFNIYAVYIDPRDGTLTDDENCFIGWDPNLETYFFQSGLLIDPETDEPLIWLGSEPHEHPEIDQFLEALSHIAKSPDIHEIWEELASKLD